MNKKKKKKGWKVGRRKKKRGRGGRVGCTYELTEAARDVGHVAVLDVSN